MEFVLASLTALPTARSPSHVQVGHPHGAANFNSLCEPAHSLSEAVYSPRAIAVCSTMFLAEVGSLGSGGAQRQFQDRRPTLSPCRLLNGDKRASTRDPLQVHALRQAVRAGERDTPRDVGGIPAAD